MHEFISATPKLMDQFVKILGIQNATSMVSIFAPRQIFKHLLKINVPGQSSKKERQEGKKKSKVD